MENNRKVNFDGLLEFVPLMVKINNKSYITSEELARIFNEEHSSVKEWVMECFAVAEKQGLRKGIKKDFLKRKLINGNGDIVDSFFISGDGFFYIGHHIKDENTDKDKLLLIIKLIESFSYVKANL